MCNLKCVKFSIANSTNSVYNAVLECIEGTGGRGVGMEGGAWEWRAGGARDVGFLIVECFCRHHILEQRQEKRTSAG